MAYEVVMSYHLHMPSYFLGTFTEYPQHIPVPYPAVVVPAAGTDYPATLHGAGRYLDVYARIGLLCIRYGGHCPVDICKETEEVVSSPVLILINRSRLRSPPHCRRTSVPYGVQTRHRAGSASP